MNQLLLETIKKSLGLAEEKSLPPSITILIIFSGNGPKRNLQQYKEKFPGNGKSTRNSGDDKSIK